MSISRETTREIEDNNNDGYFDINLFVNMPQRNEPSHLIISSVTAHPN